MTTSEPLASKPAEPDRSRLFWAAAAVIVGLQILLGLIAFPPGLRIGPIPAVAAVTILSGVVVLGASLTGLFLAASRSWTAGRAALWLAGGIAVQAGSVLALGFLKPAGPVVVLLQGAAQGGLLVWCAGLGALIALLFRDRNLIVPV
ncbi:MAG: hypothetical protein MH204_02330, partial [Fimbriimonadaceae bacterium]|nr:hypothetical protein [Fimbriimonadaceae bacterium]